MIQGLRMYYIFYTKEQNIVFWNIVYKKEDICLSSTSPANAKKKLEDLVEEYKKIIKFL